MYTMVTRVVIFTMIADWLVNISAGWFGAAIILPATRDWPRKLHIGIIATNLVLALACFFAAVIIKSKL